MHALLIILLVIVGIIVLLLILAAFSKKDYAVERQVVINRSQPDVFNYIRYLKNQNKFSKWASMDPHMKQEFRGEDGTVGFISAWDSDNKNVGKGEQEITAIQEGRQVDYEIRFVKPFASVAPAYMKVESAGGQQTTVKWGFKGHMSYPMNAMMMFLNMEKMIGNDFETGLRNLKTILEK